MNDQRIYIKFNVLNPKPLVDIQSTLISKWDDNFKTTQAFHLTLLHLGKPSELYTELLQFNPSLTSIQFKNSLSTFIKQTLRYIETIDTSDLRVKIESLGISDLEAEIESLDIFSKNAVVVRLQITEKVKSIRREFFNYLKQFLHDCGINDIDKFIPQSENLKYQIDYNPHTTIGAVENPCVELSTVQFSKSQIALGSPILVS